MKLKNLSLRTRIFLAMIILVILSSILFSTVAIYQYKKQSEEYHTEHLENKERNIQTHLSRVLNGRENTWEVNTENIPKIFKEEIYNIADIHKLQINLYDLEGGLLISSRASFQSAAAEPCLNAKILNAISNTAEHMYVDKHQENGEIFQSSYTYLFNQQSKPIAILNLPFLEKDNFLTNELLNFLQRILITFIIVLILAIFVALLLSKYITKSLQTISDKINATRLEKRNEKIEIGETSEEIYTLVSSYNSMIDELEESAIKLARSEREQAWREMAKQVAHEIKNPLTPMRLTVQNFKRKFNPNDTGIYEKVDEYSTTLIQQIDTLSAIASAFSSFANMPAQQIEELNVVKVVKLALDIFTEEYIEFQAPKEDIIAKFDKTQLIRLVTNLVKNGIQAIPDDRNPKIVINLSATKQEFMLEITDNGVGIPVENLDKVFEPKFTTKTSGMGLGLAMVKKIIENHKGQISISSEAQLGTTFTITLPKS